MVQKMEKNGFFVHLHVRLRLKTAFLPFVLGLSPMPVWTVSAIILNYEGKNDKNTWNGMVQKMVK